MNKLLDVDFIIQKDNKTIVLDIKHMDESLRKGNDDPIIKSDCGKYFIYSVNSPQIGRCELFLKGTKKEEDSNFAYYTFNSTEEMNEYIENMNKLIDEINNPMIEVDITKEKDYETFGYKIGVSPDDDYTTITIRKGFINIKNLYIDDNEIEGQPFDEVVEEFDNFCKRRNIKAKLVR